MELGKSSRPVWEYFVVSFVVMITLLLSVGLYAKRDQLLKTRLLQLELVTLRNQVITHLLENKKLPENLNEVAGNQTDPFGQSYQYNSTTGWVSSVSL